MGKMLKGLGLLSVLTVLGGGGFLFYSGRLDGPYYKYKLQAAEELTYEQAKQQAADLKPEDAAGGKAPPGSIVIWKGELEELRRPADGLHLLVVKAESVHFGAVYGRALGGIEVGDTVEVAGILERPLRPVTASDGSQLDTVFACDVRKVVDPLRESLRKLLEFGGGILNESGD